MYERLIDLMTLDRLVEMVGPDRLRALVERNLAVADVLDALSKGDGVDHAAVRAALDALPTGAASVGGSAVAGGDAFDGMDRLIRNLSVPPAEAGKSQPPFIPNPADGSTAQTTWMNKLAGRNPAAGRTRAEGYCYASVVNPPTDPDEAYKEHETSGLHWRERYVLRGVDEWLSSRGQFEHLDPGDEPWTAQNSEELAHTAWVDQIQAYKENAPKGSIYTMVADFKYGGLPALTGLPPEADLPAPKGTVRRHFKLTGRGLSNSDQGYLLQDVTVAGNARIVSEHWILPSDYVGPRKDINLDIEPTSRSTPTLREFIQQGHDDKQRWYVPLVYGVQQVLGQPAGFASRR